MFKRLLLVGMLAVMLVSPGFAAIAGCETDSCVVSCDGASCVAKDTQNCDVSTIGLYSGSLTLRARWRALSYACEPGKFLNAESGECEVCESGYYCGGTGEISFDGIDHGAVRCDTNYPNSDAGAKTEAECYQIVPVPCSLKNPYDGGNGSAVYVIADRNVQQYGVDRTNSKADCKRRQGQEYSECELVDSSLCEIARLECYEGYRQEEIDGEKVCVREDMVKCVAGTYLKKGERVCSKCPEDSYCAGSGDDVFAMSTTQDQGIVACEEGLKSPQGASSVKDCGYVLRVGEDRIYLHKDKRTSPSLRVDIAGEAWYANATPVSEGAKPLPSGRTFHIKTKTGEYTVHTALCVDEECEE